MKLFFGFETNLPIDVITPAITGEFVYIPINYGII